MFDTIAHPKKRAFLAAYSECGEVKQSAELAGISRELHYDWKAQDEDYAVAFAHAAQLAGDALEDEATRRAMRGSDRLLMFLLTGAKPEKYKTRVASEISGPGGGAISVDLTHYTEEELDVLERLARKAGAFITRSDPGGARTETAEQAGDAVSGDRSSEP